MSVGALDCATQDHSNSTVLTRRLSKNGMELNSKQYYAQTKVGDLDLPNLEKCYWIAQPINNCVDFSR